MSPAIVWAWAPVVHLHSLQMHCGRLGYFWKGTQASPLSGKTPELPEVLDNQDNNAGSFPAAGGGPVKRDKRESLCRRGAQPATAGTR